VDRSVTVEKGDTKFRVMTASVGPDRDHWIKPVAHHGR
jgi:hypothetical protein